MSAKHEELAFLRSLSLYAAEAAALQARMPAFQSVGVLPALDAGVHVKAARKLTRESLSVGT